MIRIAQLIVRDGEGQPNLSRSKWQAVKPLEECAKIAYEVAHSPLVKNRILPATQIEDVFWQR